MTEQNNPWSDKTVWVTGANQGIGEAIAALFVKLGAKVIGIDQQFSGQLDPMLKQYSDRFKAITLDIANADAVKATCQELLNQGERIDVLVNVAGILRMGQVDELSSEDWQQSLAVNVSGPFHLMQALIPTLKRQGHGNIVSVSSNANHMPRIAMAAYSASKAALTNLTMVAGLELAQYGIRCNVVSPGSTQTPMQWSMWQDQHGEANTIKGNPEQFKPGIPLQKLALPQDIAQTVVFLASAQANHITLQDIVIDGGATLGG